MHNPFSCLEDEAFGIEEKVDIEASEDENHKLSSLENKTTANEEIDVEHEQTETKDNTEKFKSMLKEHYENLERSMEKVSAALDRSAVPLSRIDLTG